MMGWVDYDTHARTRPRDDLWGQVRRTVGGRPVPPGQIDMIVAAIVRQLDLQPGDVLLDLACGNGALGSRLQPFCAASLGVDMSEYLVGVAQERFSGPLHEFVVGDAATFCEQAPSPARFTKALCYGSLSYFTDADVRRLLHGLASRFPGLERVLLGNLPDLARVGLFRRPGALLPLREVQSDLGMWRTAGEIEGLALPEWRVTVSTMPPEFHAAHYRFDALLVRST